MSVSSGLVALVAVVCLLGGPFLCGMFHAVCSTIEKVSKQRADANLKLEMIRRGFTADDIERVCKMKLDPRHESSEDWKPIPPAKPAKA